MLSPKAMYTLGRLVPMGRVTPRASSKTVGRRYGDAGRGPEGKVGGKAREHDLGPRGADGDLAHLEAAVAVGGGRAGAHGDRDLGKADLLLAPTFPSPSSS